MLTLFGATTFSIGLVLPFVRIAPGQKLGPVEGFAIWLLSDDESYSLFGSIVGIWEESAFLGIVAFVFSILLPLSKFVALAYCIYSEKENTGGFWQSWTERVGSWSMLEVFLVALTLLLIKSLPFGTAIEPRSGFYAFWISIVVTMLASRQLPTRHVEHDSPAVQR